MDEKYVIELTAEQICVVSSCLKTNYDYYRSPCRKLKDKSFLDILEQSLSKIDSVRLGRSVCYDRVTGSHYDV